ncbi:FG-GAP-like repeat-containing protein [Spinactinospora alkalitolerans]
MLLAACAGTGTSGEPPVLEPSGYAPTATPDGDAAALNDVNGDGYADFAVSGEWVRGVEEEPVGHKAVGYGSDSGLDPAEGTSFNDLVPDEPGEYGDGLLDGTFAFNGDVLEPMADLDQDGYADLVVIGDTEQYLVRGSEDGPADAVALALDRPADAVGDFNGDGFPDIIAAGRAALGGAADDSERTDREALHSRVLYGPFSASGEPAATGRFDGTQGGWVPVGGAVAGDFDGDGRDDLVVFGFYWEEDARFEERGAPQVESVVYFRGTDEGMVAAGAVQELSVGYTGGPVEYETGAAGDVDGDGDDDLIVPNGGVFSVSSGITVLYGGPEGPGSGGEKTEIDQESPGVPGDTEADDMGEAADGFGENPAVGDVDGDGFADVAVAAPGEDEGRGSVTVLRGGPDGLSGAGAQRIGLDSPGVPEEPSGGPGPEGGDRFGADLSLVDLDGDGRTELVVGAGGYRRGTERPGGYWVFTATEEGPSTRDAVFFAPQSLGG